MSLQGDSVGQTSGPVVLLLKGRVGTGGMTDFTAFLRDALPLYEGLGGLRVRLFVNTAEPDAFVEMVEYDDTDAYTNDQERVESDPAMVEALDRWRALLAGPVVVETYLDITPGRTDHDGL